MGLVGYSPRGHRASDRTEPLSHSAPLVKESESGVTQSYWTLCDPMDGSLPGSSVHKTVRQEYCGGFVISFSRESS